MIMSISNINNYMKKIALILTVIFTFVSACSISTKNITADDNTFNLVITNEVTGSHADKEKEFEFTVKVYGRKTYIEDETKEPLSYSRDFDLKNNHDREFVELFGTEDMDNEQFNNFCSKHDVRIMFNNTYEGTVPTGDGYYEYDEVRGIGIVRDSQVAWTGDRYYVDSGDHTYDPDLPEDITVTISAIEFLDLTDFGGTDNGDESYTFKLKHGESITIKDIPDGYTYKVTEKDYSSELYTTTVDGSDTRIATGKISNNTTHLFTNEKELYSLTINKQANSEGEFNFEINSSNRLNSDELTPVNYQESFDSALYGSGGFFNLYNIVYEYEYGEKYITLYPESNQWRLSHNGFDKYLPENNVILEQEPEIKRGEYDAIVDALFEYNGFKFHFSDDGGGTCALTIVPVSYQYRTEIENGKKVIIDNIPSKTQYEIYETDSQYKRLNIGDEIDSTDWKLKSITGNNTGTLTQDTEVTFTNELATISATHKLTIKKETVDDVPGLFEFELILKDSNDNPVANTTFGTGDDSLTTDENGKAVFTLENGNSKVIRDLPHNTKYELSEKDYSDQLCKTTVDGNEGRSISGQMLEDKTHNFVNEIATFNLTANKKVIGSREDLEKEFEFFVKVWREYLKDYQELLKTEQRDANDEWLNEIISSDDIEKTMYDDGNFEFYYLSDPDDYESGSNIIVIIPDNSSSGKYELEYYKAFNLDNCEYLGKGLYRASVPECMDLSSSGGVLAQDDTYLFKLTDGNSFTIEDIPYGYKYSIAEFGYELDLYTTTVDGINNNSVEGVMTEDKTHNFVNEKQEFDLTIKKETDIETDEEFNFVIKTDKQNREYYSSGISKSIIGSSWDTGVNLLGSTVKFETKNMRFEYFDEQGREVENPETYYIGDIEASIDIDGNPDSEYYDSRKGFVPTYKLYLHKGENDFLLYISEDGNFYFANEPNRGGVKVCDYYKFTVDSNEYVDLSDYGMTETDIKGEYKFTLKKDESVTIRDISNQYEYEIYELDSEGNRLKVGDEFGGKWKLESQTKTIGSPVKDITETFVNKSLPQIYTITYDLNGGTNDGHTGIYSIDYKAGTKIYLPIPSRNGYIFDYWEGSRYEGGQAYTVNEDHIFKAIWKQKSERTTAKYVIPKTGIE